GSCSVAVHPCGSLSLRLDVELECVDPSGMSGRRNGRYSGHVSEWQDDRRQPPGSAVERGLWVVTSDLAGAVADAQSAPCAAPIPWHAGRTDDFVLVARARFDAEGGEEDS